MTPVFPMEALINAVIFAVLGVVLLVGSFAIWDRITPYNLWKEIVEEQNVALAVFAGMMALGIAVIVAAAVH